MKVFSLVLLVYDPLVMHMTILHDSHDYFEARARVWLGIEVGEKSADLGVHFEGAGAVKLEIGAGCPYGSKNLFIAAPYKANRLNRG